MGASSFFKNDNKTNLGEQEYIDKIVDIQRRRGKNTVNTWWDRWKEDTTNRDDFPTYFEKYDRLYKRRGNNTINTWWDRWKEDTTNRDDFPTYFERNN